MPPKQRKNNNKKKKRNTAAAEEDVVVDTRNPDESPPPSTSTSKITMTEVDVDYASTSRMCRFPIYHGNLMVINFRGSGTCPRKNWHAVFNCSKSYSVCADVAPKSLSPRNPDGFETSSMFAGEIPANNQSAEHFVKNEINGNVFAFRTERFNQNWPSIHRQLQRLIKEEDLTPIEYPKRGALSSGYDYKLTMELLSKIPEFKEYICDLKDKFVVRAFWIVLHLHGVHPWHPDKFNADATHRFILSLGCSRQGGEVKCMGFADFRDVGKGDVANFIG